MNGLDANNSRGLPIDALNLSVRAQNALKNSEIQTIDDLLKLNQDNLESIPNIGAKTVRELINFINS